MPERMWSSGNSHSPVVGMQNGTAFGRQLEWAARSHFFVILLLKLNIWFICYNSGNQILLLSHGLFYYYCKVSLSRDQPEMKPQRLLWAFIFSKAFKFPHIYRLFFNVHKKMDLAPLNALESSWANGVDTMIPIICACTSAFRSSAPQSERKVLIAHPVPASFTRNKGCCPNSSLPWN